MPEDPFQDLIPKRDAANPFADLVPQKSVAAAGAGAVVQGLTGRTAPARPNPVNHDLIGDNLPHSQPKPQPRDLIEQAKTRKWTPKELKQIAANKAAEELNAGRMVAGAVHVATHGYDDFAKNAISRGADPGLVAVRAQELAKAGPRKGPTPQGNPYEDLIKGNVTEDNTGHRGEEIDPKEMNAIVTRDRLAEFSDGELARYVMGGSSETRTRQRKGVFNAKEEQEFHLAALAEAQRRLTESPTFKQIMHVLSAPVVSNPVSKKVEEVATPLVAGAVTLPGDVMANLRGIQVGGTSGDLGNLSKSLANLVVEVGGPDAIISGAFAKTTAGKALSELFHASPQKFEEALHGMSLDGNAKNAIKEYLAPHAPDGFQFTSGADGHAKTGAHFAERPTEFTPKAEPHYDPGHTPDVKQGLPKALPDPAVGPKLAGKPVVRGNTAEELQASLQEINQASKNAVDLGLPPTAEGYTREGFIRDHWRGAVQKDLDEIDRLLATKPSAAKVQELKKQRGLLTHLLKQESAPSVVADEIGAHYDALTKHSMPHDPATAPPTLESHPPEPLPEPTITGASQPGKKPDPLIPTESRMSSTLAPQFHSIPDEGQTVLRDELVHNLTQGNIESGADIYNKMGLPHKVHKGFGSFDGTISPNYVIEPLNADLPTAKVIAAMEGKANLQDAAAVIHIDPNGKGTLSVIVGGTDPINEARARDIYKVINRSGETPIEFSSLPDGRLIFGNFTELPGEEFLARMDRLKGSYNLNIAHNAGDYLNEKAFPGSYESVVREVRNSDAAGRRPLDEGEFHRLFTDPRVKAYRAAAERHGLDADAIEQQLRSAADEVRAWLDEPPKGAANKPEPPAPKGSQSGALSTSEPKPEPPKIDTAKKADIDKLRENLGWGDKPEGGTRSWEDAVNEAVKDGTLKKADSIAAAVNKKPRALSDSETAALGIRLNQHLANRDAAEKAIVDAIKKGDANAEAIAREEFGLHDQAAHNLADALDSSGTEKGRGLNAQKLVLKSDYSKFGMERKAIRAVSRKLTDDELAQVSKSAEEISAAEAAVKKAQAAKARKEAAKEFDKTPPARKRVLVSDESYEQAKKDLFGSANAGLGLRQVEALGKIVGYHLESGYQTLAQLFEAVKRDAPGIDDDDLWLAVHDGLNDHSHKINAGRGFGEDILIEGKAGIQSQEVRELRLRFDALRQEMRTAGHTADTGLLDELKTKVDELGKMVGTAPFDLKRYEKLRADIGDVSRKLNAGRVEGDNLLRSGVHGIEDPSIQALREHLEMKKLEADRYVKNLQLKEEWENLSTGAKAGKHIYDLFFSAPRTLKASLDLSAPGRQGLFLLVTNPKESALASRRMFQAMRSEDGFLRAQAALRAHPDFGSWQKAGLFLADVDAPLNVAAQEEVFASRLAGKIPGVSHSERAYTGFLNSQRYGVAKSFSEAARAAGKPLTAAEMKELANAINIMTGRGTGRVADGLATLNAAFFAPRYAWSRVQLAVGAPLISSIKSTGFASASTKIIAKKYIQFLTPVVTTVGLLKAAGAQVETDPKSTNFLKLKVGENSYLDLFGGVQQPVRVLWQSVFGSIDKNGKAQPPDPKSTLGNYAFYKASPLAAAAAQLVTGKDAVGNPMTPTDVGLGLFSPIAPGNIPGNIREEGWAKGLAMSAGSMLGFETNTMPPKADPLGRPYTPATKNDPTLRELERIGYERSAPDKREGESDQDKAKRGQALGDYIEPRLEKVMESQAYKNKTLADKTAFVKRLELAWTKQFNRDYSVAQRQAKVKETKETRSQQKKAGVH